MYDLKKLNNQAEEKLAYAIDKFVVASDGLEIATNDSLMELAKNENELWLIAMPAAHEKTLAIEVDTCTTISQLNQLSDSLCKEHALLEQKLLCGRPGVVDEFKNLKRKLAQLKEARVKLLNKKSTEVTSKKEDSLKSANKPEKVQPTPENPVNRPIPTNKRPSHAYESIPTTLQARLSVYLLSELFNQSFDILFMFHSFNLNKDEPSLLTYLHSRLEQCDIGKTRFALGFYYASQKSTSFELSQFYDWKKLTTRKTQVDDIQDIKSDIYSLDWSANSHKLVINITREENFILNVLVPDKNAEAVMSSEDILGQRIKSANIYKVKKSVKKLDTFVIDDILSEFALSNTMGLICHELCLKELYVLKRKRFASFEDYENYRNKSAQALVIHI